MAECGRDLHVMLTSDSVKLPSGRFLSTVFVLPKGTEIVRSERLTVIGEGFEFENRGKRYRLYDTPDGRGAAQLLDS